MISASAFAVQLVDPSVGVEKKMRSHALPDGRVGLLGFDTNLFQQMPLACEVPPKGLHLKAVPSIRLLKSLSFHLCCFL